MSSLRQSPLLLALILSVAAYGTAAPRLEAQEARPRILVSNDDGIGSEGIAAIAAELSAFAEVVVVAPSDNRSSSSNSTGIRRTETEVRPFLRDGELFGYGISGTPADAVKVGILQFGAERPFDLVVSGINAGANTGNVAHHSGTVGAAMEAMYNGVPSVATSQNAQQDYALTARITADIVRRVLRDGLPEGVMLSINVPAGELRGIVARRMGGTYFGVGGLEEVATTAESTSYRAVLRGAERGGEDTDTAAYLDGYATVTPLRFDWTDEDMLGVLQGWEIQLGP